MIAKLLRPARNVIATRKQERHLPPLDERSNRQRHAREVLRFPAPEKGLVTACFHGCHAAAEDDAARRVRPFAAFAFQGYAGRRHPFALVNDLCDSGFSKHVPTVWQKSLRSILRDF